MDNVVETDVLVIGSGAAGLTAAIEAKRRGIEVTLVSKSPIGLNNCSSYSMGAFRVAVGGYTRDKHFKDTMEGGKFLNNKNIVYTMVQEAPSLMFLLRGLGVNLQITAGRCQSDGPPLRLGEGITQPLRKAAINSGIQTIENTIILNLIRENNAVIGAVGINTAGEFTVYSAKAVVLASGGAGQLYSRNDNPVGTTGDGYALALRVGAELIDMEFIQFFPIGLAEKMLPTYLFLTDIGILRNAFGEPFLEKMNLDIDAAVTEKRDLSTRLIFSEIMDGRGEGETVLLDLTGLSDEAFHKSRWFMKIGKRLLKSFPYNHLPIHVSPLVHHIMGGIKINNRTETALNGLYAAGEVTGGVHGANRMGGNALTDAVVFGSRAGNFSSRYALTAEKIEIDNSVIDRETQRVTKLFNVKGPEIHSPKDLRKKIQSIMWQYVGIGRTAARLKESIQILTKLKSHFKKKILVKNYREAIVAIELFNMLDVAEVIAMTALNRTESRGAHYRLDFPEQDAKWRKNISVFISKNGKVKLRDAI